MPLKSSQGIIVDNHVTLRDVLVVDADPRTAEMIGQGIQTNPPATVRSAGSVDQATLEMRRKVPDVVIVNVHVNDNSGLALLTKLRHDYPRTQAIALCRAQDTETCLGAWRAGASDLIVAPMDPSAVQACLSRAQARSHQNNQLRWRNARLRSVCKQLNKARHEISQQVDLLCHDLVKAYQDLAEQLNQTQVCSEFADALRAESGMEGLLRRTLEWLLKKNGPVNAAVFLPNSQEEYTLGAYLNFDTNADSVLVDTIATTIVPQAAQGSGTLALQNDDQLKALYEGNSSLLLGRTWLACPADYNDECMAVVVLFQSQGDNLDPAWHQRLEAMGPVLAERIAGSVRVHQRGLFAPPGDVEPFEGPEPQA